MSLKDRVVGAYVDSAVHLRAAPGRKFEPGTRRMRAQETVDDGLTPEGRLVLQMFQNCRNHLEQTLRNFFGRG